MLKRVVWTVLYGALGAGFTIASRRLASRVWRLATGEEPPARR